MNKHRLLLLAYPARKKTHWRRAMACALTALTALTATMSCMAASVAERNGPIRVGAVSSLSGPAQFPESSAAVRALFDVVNADGGVRGRRLELIVEDDRGDPA